ncbi:chymotrypsin inhibitor-like [Leptinotarsa decemlineata]|uniref:chymotrypsin inhibitor-like n=1 Tax=Leptinotarsa decemlineata TaxID=7539 RepID=UPI003D308A51
MYTTRYTEVKMGKTIILAFVVFTFYCFLVVDSDKQCGPHQRFFECRPCRSVSCGTTPPDVCIALCIEEPGCYCEEGYREKDGKCVLPCDC